MPTTAKYNCPHCPYEVQEIHESNLKRHLNDQHKYNFKTIKLEAYCRDKKKDEKDDTEDEKDDTEDEKDDTAIMITVFFLIMITVVFAQLITVFFAILITETVVFALRKQSSLHYL